MQYMSEQQNIKIQCKCDDTQLIDYSEQFCFILLRINRTMYAYAHDMQKITNVLNY